MGRVAAMLMTVLLATVGLAQGHAAEVGPTWSSDRIRAMRGETSERAIVFNVRQEIRTAGVVPKVETSRVVLAPDFTYITSGETHVLDDFKLRRMFSWSDGAATFTALNGHALPAFRVIELASRRAMNTALSGMASTSGKPLGPSDGGPYWREAELGVSDPSETPLTVRHSGSDTDFLLENDPVVRVHGRAYDLSEADRQPFTRYLALHLPLHPQTRHALTDAGVLPTVITVELYALTTKETIVFTFAQPGRALAAYPLPAGLASDVQADFASPKSGSEAGVHAAVQAIDGRFANPKPTPDDITSALRKAAAAGRPMEVYLWWAMFVQQYGFELKGVEGPELIKTLVPLIKAALQDPAVARLERASNLAGGAPGGDADRQEAARYLASATALDALPFGTFRYLTFANLVQGSKDTATWDKTIFRTMPSPLVANYWRHIAAYPWAGNAYNDVGGSYLRAFDTPKAWTAFDLGRAVDPNWRSGSLQSVANYEAVLEANAPDFF